MSKKLGEAFCATRPCGECPWRKDVPVGRFPPERYVALASSVQQGFNPMFACHKSPEGCGNEFACVGYLLSPESRNNFAVRLALIQGRIDLSKLSTDAPMFESYAEMANGVSDATYLETESDDE